MGCFDTVCIECDLPPSAPDWLKDCPVFQTYDLGGMMGDYSITKDRKLVIVDTCIGETLREALGVAKQPPIPVKYKRKKLLLYASNIRGGRKVGKEYRQFTEDGSPCVSLHYRVWIYNGKAGPIREVSRVEKPALPMSKF